jgi:hypothetical protein
VEERWRIGAARGGGTVEGGVEGAARAADDRGERDRRVTLACLIAAARETAASESRQCAEPGAAQLPAGLRVRPGFR